MNQYIVTVDLGELNDYTAITVLQEVYVAKDKGDPRMLMRGHLPLPQMERMYHLRHIERPVLRTPYPEIVDRVGALMRSPQLKDNADLVIDATGVGRPVVEMFDRAGIGNIPITITGGYGVTARDDGGFSVPKRDLAAALQALFGSDRLKVASGLPLADVFLKEMENFKMKISQTGATSFEAWREKDHDDIVLSVALGAWYVITMRSPMIVRRVKKEQSETDYLRYGL